MYIYSEYIKILRKLLWDLNLVIAFTSSNLRDEKKNNEKESCLCHTDIQDV